MLGSQTQLPLMIGPPVGLGAALLVFSQLSASADPAVTPRDARTTHVVMRNFLNPTLPLDFPRTYRLRAIYVRFTRLPHTLVRALL